MKYILLILFSIIFVRGASAEPPVCQTFNKSCFSNKVAILATKNSMTGLLYGACLSWGKTDCKKEYNNYITVMNQEGFTNCEECFGKTSPFKECKEFREKVCFPKIPLK